MSATVLRFPTQLRVVPNEPSLLDRLRASLTPALSGWHKARVLVTALGVTGRVEGMVSDKDSPLFGRLGVAQDDGECGFYYAGDLQRLASRGGAA